MGDDDSFAPQIASIPEEVRRGVAHALGISVPSFRRLHGGTTARTFLVTNAPRRWVLRNVNIFDEPTRNEGIRMQRERLQVYIRRRGWEA